ncbi:MAG: hypothetical protein U9Q69_03240 [Nanoarchaeota archaeon]|nr:hypothetical protein [Nanoarchaeota archaeon]
MKNNIWFRQLGYHNNPFSIKPAAYHDELFGSEDLVAKVIKRIAKGGFVFIEGDYGEGKTTVLKRILRHFGGHKKVIYFSINRIENRLHVRKLLNERYGRLGKWFDLRPKDMILLLDEVQEISKKDIDKLLRFRKLGHFKSIVCVSQKFDEELFPEVLSKDLTVFKLAKLKDKDAIKIIRKRVGYLPLLPDEMIKKIFQHSNSNVRKLLMNCEILCKKAIEYGSEQISNKMLTDLFGKNVVEEAPEEDKIFLELEEAENEMEKEPLEEIEEEKPKEEMDMDDVAIDERFEKEKQEFELGNEIDEELAKVKTDEEEEEEKKVKMTNGRQEAVVAEESITKPNDLVDENYY